MLYSYMHGKTGYLRRRNRRLVVVCILSHHEDLTGGTLSYDFTRTLSSVIVFEYCAWCVTLAHLRSSRHDSTELERFFWRVWALKPATH